MELGINSGFPLDLMPDNFFLSTCLVYAEILSIKKYFLLKIRVQLSQSTFFDKICLKISKLNFQKGKIENFSLLKIQF
jgi:hypothetical protein